MNENQTKQFIENIINTTGDIRQFYKTYVWKSFRKTVMTKKKNRCELCWNGGADGTDVRKYRRATVLHHIKHLRDFPNLALSENNMMALCKYHHREMHPEEIKKIQIIERWD